MTALCWRSEHGMGAVFLDKGDDKKWKIRCDLRSNLGPNQVPCQAPTDSLAHFQANIKRKALISTHSYFPCQISELGLSLDHANQRQPLQLINHEPQTWVEDRKSILPPANSRNQQNIRGRQSMEEEISGGERHLTIYSTYQDRASKLKLDIFRH